ncbi:uncharacterized protein TM35_000371710 [Trypanosoma theileri]|uniref:PX domain-containing protein n=1 Tax=Trypanosoma theileri TaxID=67003 RepID=A0A1X0NKZ7_9TRYP|nr:uncharacterized protein TM35_000371710 [Trypanosoma theileri]ORC85198.1 hypothetical protein TM35_000371710 [Trypanosoma theileri]
MSSLRVVDEMAHIKVSAIDYLQYEGKMQYNFQVCFGSRRDWVLSKLYDDFTSLHAQLEKQYGSSKVPHLTGAVRLWARNSSSTAAGRLPKLEAYLNELLIVSPLWTPTSNNIVVQDPDDSTGFITLNKFLYTFLEVEEHTVNTTSLPKQIPQLQTSGLLNTTELNPDTTPAATPVATRDAALVPLSTSRSAELGNTRKPIVPMENERGTASSHLISPSPSSSSLLVSSLPQPHARALSAAAMLSSTSTPKMESCLETENTPKRDSEELALAATASTITGQILLNVKDFTILDGAHIVYLMHVFLCGHHWVLSRRYSEFRTLHESLVRVYGETVVPPLRCRVVPAWRKLTAETGEARRHVLDTFMRDVVASIDTWTPCGLLASVDLTCRTGPGSRGRIRVYVNQLLFDFLDIADQVDALSGEAAAQAVGDQRDTLPESVKVAYDRHALQEQQLRMCDSIAANAQKLSRMDDAQLQLLLHFIPLLADDRDVMRMFRHLVFTGEVGVNINSTFADWVNDDLMLREREQKDQERQEQEKKGKDGGEPVLGVTARQLASLTERLFFNDTKMEAIRLFAGVLVDIDGLQDVFDTLWFNWDEARKEVEQILSRC